MVAEVLASVPVPGPWLSLSFPAAGARRMRITSNGWAAVAGAGVMFAMAIQTQSVWMQVVGSALLGLLGISWLAVVARRPGLMVTISRPLE